MPDPDEIWLAPECHADLDEGRTWCDDPTVWDGNDGQPVRYVRADIAKRWAREAWHAGRDVEKYVSDIFKHLEDIYRVQSVAIRALEPPTEQKEI